MLLPLTAGIGVLICRQRRDLSVHCHSWQLSSARWRHWSDQAITVRRICLIVALFTSRLNRMRWWLTSPIGPFVFFPSLAVSWDSPWPQIESRLVTIGVVDCRTDYYYYYKQFGSSAEWGCFLFVRFMCERCSTERCDCVLVFVLAVCSATNSLMDGVWGRGVLGCS